MKETIDVFLESYVKSFTDDGYEEDWTSLISDESVNEEVRSIDFLMSLLKKNDVDVFRKYVCGEYANIPEWKEMYKHRNTITCGYYDMSMLDENSDYIDYNFAFHNETIPDHLGKQLNLNTSNEAALFWSYSGGLTPPLFFKNLQEEGRKIISRCCDVKREIFFSDDKFKNENPSPENKINLQVNYLLEEAKRFDVVSKIGEDMKNVYSVLNSIVEGMIKRLE